MARTRIRTSEAHDPHATAKAVFVLVVTVLATAAKLAFLASMHASGMGLWSRPF